MSSNQFTYYAGNYIYKKASSQSPIALTFFNSEEGYIEPIIDNEGGNNIITGFEYTYQYKDHLGNIRLSYQDLNGDNIVDQEEIKEENHYYPFGLKMQGFNSQIVGSRYNRKTYKGQEIHKEFDINVIEFKYRFQPVVHFK